MSVARVPSPYDLLALCMGPEEVLRPVHNRMKEVLEQHIFQIARSNGSGYLCERGEPAESAVRLMCQFSLFHAGIFPVNIHLVSCQELVHPHRANRLVFKNQADAPDPAGALLLGKNLGDLWLEELLLGPKRPKEVPELLRVLEKDPNWVALQEYINRALGLQFARAEDAFKVEKHVKQIVHDTLRAWILNAWVKRDDVVERRIGIVRLLRYCILFGPHPTKPERWVALFA